MRKLVTLLLIGLLIGALPTAAQGKKRAAGPVTLWEDANGDADLGQGTGSSIPAGFDLIAATVVRNGTDLEFTVIHADMPAIGSLPEAARFIWAFMVDGRPYRFSVKSVDVGKPDVAAGQTTERVGRVDAQGHFRLEENCVLDIILVLTQVNCSPLEYLSGNFDVAAKTFTIVVPLTSIEAKVGSIISPSFGENTAICHICWVTHVAERSNAATIIDSALMVSDYKVPR